MIVASDWKKQNKITEIQHRGRPVCVFGVKVAGRAWPRALRAGLSSQDASRNRGGPCKGVASHVVGALPLQGGEGAVSNVRGLSGRHLGWACACLFRGQRETKLTADQESTPSWCSGWEAFPPCRQEVQGVSSCAGNLGPAVGTPGRLAGSGLALWLQWSLIRAAPPPSIPG